MAASATQWGPEETRELIWIRGELESDSTAAKRKKTLWELVSVRMRERGYFRTSDQCKCKWKNLLNRYKGKETSDPENGRQCPFFNELHAVFTQREKSMQRLLMDSEAGPAQVKKRMKRTTGDRSSVEFSEDEAAEGFDSEEEKPGNGSRKRKSDKNIPVKSPTDGASNNASAAEILREFLQQQQRLETQWQEIMEKRAQERELLEQEWRCSMEKQEKERLMAEQAWREREEQRRIREESRAERRDALLTTLLNRLITDNNI